MSTCYCWGVRSIKAILESCSYYINEETRELPQVLKFYGVIDMASKIPAFFIQVRFMYFPFVFIKNCSIQLHSASIYSISDSKDLVTIGIDYF